MDFNKTNELFSCKTGDIVECSDGKQYEMIKINRVNFVAKEVKTGVAYDIPFEMFLRVVSRKKSKDSEINSLKPGDLFVINNKGKALLFKFKSCSGDKIFGINPLTGVEARISKSMYAAKVDSL